MGMNSVVIKFMDANENENKQIYDQMDEIQKERSTVIELKPHQV